MRVVEYRILRHSDPVADGIKKYEAYRLVRDGSSDGPIRRFERVEGIEGHSEEDIERDLYFLNKMMELPVLDFWEVFDDVKARELRLNAHSPDKPYVWLTPEFTRGITR